MSPPLVAAGQAGTPLTETPCNNRSTKSHALSQLLLTHKHRHDLFYFESVNLEDRDLMRVYAHEAAAVYVLAGTDGFNESLHRRQLLVTSVRSPAQSPPRAWHSQRRCSNSWPRCRSRPRSSWSCRTCLKWCEGPLRLSQPARWLIPRSLLQDRISLLKDVSNVYLLSIKNVTENALVRSAMCPGFATFITSAISTSAASDSSEAVIERCGPAAAARSRPP